MIWQSWSDFFAMGGYALYVWGSMMVVFLFIAGEIISLKYRSKSIHTQLKLSAQRENNEAKT